MLDLDGIEQSLPIDRGRTHWQGCYTEWRHRACAIVRLLALARAGRLMRAAGANLRVCSAVRETGSCGQCERLWDEAEAAWREADGA